MDAIINYIEENSAELSYMASHPHFKLFSFIMPVANIVIIFLLSRISMFVEIIADGKVVIPISSKYNFVSIILSGIALISQIFPLSSITLIVAAAIVIILIVLMVLMILPLGIVCLLHLLPILLNPYDITIEAMLKLILVTFIMLVSYASWISTFSVVALNIIKICVAVV